MPVGVELSGRHQPTASPRSLMQLQPAVYANSNRPLRPAAWRNSTPPLTQLQPAATPQSQPIRRRDAALTWRLSRYKGWKQAGLMNLETLEEAALLPVDTSEQRYLSLVALPRYGKRLSGLKPWHQTP